MKGKISTDAYLPRRTCRRGSYLSTSERAASSSALGEPSKGQQTSTRMMEELSGDMIVRSGRLAPDVPGMACSFILVPKCVGTARTIRSRTALCRSRTIPRDVGGSG